MNRTIRAIIAIFFVTVIAVTAIVICQNLTKAWRFDVTDQKIYTLSDGSKSILAKLNQPLKLKLYYTKTAAMKGPDQIQYYNNYYYFVRALLEEYEKAAKGMVQLEVIDPRPFSDEEVQAIRYGLKRFSITEEENFFFGLVLQTQFGVEKIIEFFPPERQAFVEYDISFLIDTALTREKKRIGIISSLSIFGDDVTGYMAQMMRMQGQTPKPPWYIVTHLRQRYEVNKIETEIDEIKDIDTLLVIHPKQLPEKTLFAIDQFILNGGRAVILVDPHCVIDMPSPMQMQQGKMNPPNSNMKKLFATWGIEMPDNTFAGDRKLALAGSVRQNQRPQKIIAILGLTNTDKCFNAENVITSDLNRIKVAFPGVLKKSIIPGQAEQPDIKLTPLVTTTNRGNAWKVAGYFELMSPDFSGVMQKFSEGSEPVTMAYMVTGKFKSAFPDGIDVEVVAEEGEQTDEEKAEDKKTTKHITGLTEAAENCAVIVFTDVDFLTDRMAYSRSFFGMTSIVDDNSSFLLNSIEGLTGSADLISIRSRGNFTRPFTTVEEIENEAELETAQEEARINAEIAGFQNELNEIVASAQKGEGQIIQTEILTKKRQTEVKIAAAQNQLRRIRMKKREKIEKLGDNLRNFCTLPAPAAILLIAILLGIKRSLTRKHYISHASDA